MRAVRILNKTMTSVGVALILVAASADAQQIPGLDRVQAGRQERDGNRWILRDIVEIEVRDGLQLLADEVAYEADTKILTATGNVVFAGTGQRIAADRAEFNVETETGTFYNANGMMDLGPTSEVALFGSAEPAMLFRGETIEKIGPNRYRITNGAFTTCLQPTPRWELVAGTVILHRDRYAILRGSVFKVKNVPMLYLPIFYYPINDENRATGFLIPQYGVSTIRGQTIGNAFFWAIGRSHDATVLYDWFSRTGQGLGGEYRYVLGPASAGTAQVYVLNEHPTTLTNPTGTTSTVPGRRSYQIRGNGTHDLGGGLRASGRVDYFSDITVQQTYHTNIYDASQRSRSFAGALTKTWAGYTLTGSYDRSETFFGTTASALTGTTPRVNVSRSEKPIGNSRVYVSVAGEYARLARQGRAGTTVTDAGLDRLDVVPLVRFPFTRWPFLAVNSSLSWRNTFWSERRDLAGRQIEEGISRRYFDFQSQITGPVFNRIWDTPTSGYAERIKHSIEPVFTIRRVTAIDQFDRIVQLEAVDSVVGATTQYTYGLNNRIFAKRQEGASMPTAREIVTVSINQSYYTDANAAKYDQYYRTSFSGTPPSHFSPIALQARVAPTLETLGTFRAEYDAQFGAFRSMGADATIVRGSWLNTTAGWSQRRLVKGLPGFSDPRQLDHYLNQTTQVRWPTGRIGGLYTFNYDVRLRSLLQQRLLVFYNAQCCGLTFEYQGFNFSRLGSRAPVAEDRRFNFSFTLAGLGSFSNFFGAMGGA